MRPTNDSSQTVVTRECLHQLFIRTAAKSLQVLNQVDAEPEMVEFLREVRAHPDQREFVIQLFRQSLGPLQTPWQFIQFCMHDLRWPEVRDAVASIKAADVQARGARSSTVWNSILEAFEDDWRWAKDYELFKKQ